MEEDETLTETEQKDQKRKYAKRKDKKQAIIQILNSISTSLQNENAERNSVYFQNPFIVFSFDSLTHSFVYSLKIHSIIQLFNQSIIQSIIQLFNHSIIHSIIQSIIHSIIQSFNHSIKLTHSIIQSFNHSIKLTHSIITH